MKIGMFDSGVGGLTVLNNLVKKYPNNEYIYFGDTLNNPYGNKSKEELKVLSTNIINFLINKKVDLIVNRIRIEMVKRGEMMSIEDVLDILAVNLLGAIPDEDSVVIAANHGEPVAGNESLAGQAYINIARRIAGETVPLLDLSAGRTLFQKMTSLFRWR
jgi:hypothetical protein